MSLFTVTPYNFFHTNVASDFAAVFYGSKSWHWNATHGLPVMLGLYFPFLLYSIFFVNQPRAAVVLEVVSVVYISLLRCATAHQEYRFLLPSLPFLHIAVGYTFWNIIQWCIPAVVNQSTAAAMNPSANHQSTRSSCTVFSFCCDYISYPFISIETVVSAPSAVMDQSTTTISSTGTANKTKIENENGDLSDNKNDNDIVKEIENDGMNKSENMKYSRGKGISLMKGLTLLLLIAVCVAHTLTAVYLARRHQVNRH